MGYYICFKFDTNNKAYNRDSLKRRFIEAGAWEEEDPYYNAPPTFLKLGSVVCPLGFESSNELIADGIWCEVRFSWGTHQRTFRTALYAMYDLAVRLGGKIYDPQLQKIVKADEMHEIVQKFYEG